MGILSLLILIAIVYISLAFIIPAIIVPNLGFYKTKTPKASKKIKELAKKFNKIKDDERFVKEVFLYIAKRYKIAHNPLTFILNLHRLFWHNPNKIIEKENTIAYCHVQNLLIKTIFLESKRFKESDIKRKITFTAVIHQHLAVNVKDKKIHLDPWAYDKRIPCGEYLNMKNFLSGHHSPKETARIQ